MEEEAVVVVGIVLAGFIAFLMLAPFVFGMMGVSMWGWSGGHHWMMGGVRDGTSGDVPTGTDVVIENYAYSPRTLEVEVGTTVTWVNIDSAMHTVTSGDPPSRTDEFGSGYLEQGETWSYTFDEAGTYQYFCLPHPYVKGEVVVTG